MGITSKLSGNKLIMENKSWSTFSSEIIEITEKILLDIPTYYLPFNKPWVCKLWTEILLEPTFWIQKLKKNGIEIDDMTIVVLKEFEMKIQVACLYHACLHEEHTLLETPLDDITSKLISKLRIDRPFEIDVSDDNEMLMTAALLVNIKTTYKKIITLHLKRETHPVFPLLCKILAARGSRVNIKDDYGFWNFSPRYDYIQMLKGPDGVANIKRLRGCVSTLEGLTQNCRHLTLSLAVDGNNKAIDPGFYFYRYKTIIYIKAGTDMCDSKNLTSGFSSLLVSGLKPTHIAWMTDLAASCDHLPGYLIFLNYELNKTDSEKLLHIIAEAIVKPYAIMCSSSTLNAEDAQQLNSLASQLRTYTGGYGDWFRWYESNEKIINMNKFIFK